jgi:hypothetical protein
MTFRLLACLALAASACDTSTPQAAAPGGVPQNLVLKSYAVPAGSAQRMRTVLRELLWFGSDGKDSNKYVGRADVGPDGQLLVLAPETVHAGVATLVAAVEKNPVKEPESLTLTYWAVVGTPGEGAERPAALKDVAPALDELEKSEGPMAFSLLEKLVVTSMSGEHGDLMGRDVNVRQYATLADGQLTGDITLERRGQRVSTRVRLPQDKLVVLASSGLVTKEESPTPKNLVFIVKATAHAGDGR